MAIHSVSFQSFPAPWIIRKLVLCLKVLGLTLDHFTSSSSEPNQLNPFAPSPSFCSTSKWSLTFMKQLQMLVPGSLGLLQCSCQPCFLSNPKSAALLVQQVPPFHLLPFIYMNKHIKSHTQHVKGVFKSNKIKSQTNKTSQVQIQF